MKARSVWCPTCHAEAGQPCLLTWSTTIPLGYEHPDRAVAARTEALAGVGRPARPSRFPWRRS